MSYENDFLEDSMKLFDTFNFEEDPRVTMKKAYNKYIFDKKWSNDIN
jgi:hypothetical protein